MYILLRVVVCGVNRIRIAVLIDDISRPDSARDADRKCTMTQVLDFYFVAVPYVLVRKIAQIPEGPPIPRIQPCFGGTIGICYALQYLVRGD
jgi:hypothetical protein